MVCLRIFFNLSTMSSCCAAVHSQAILHFKEGRKGSASSLEPPGDIFSPVLHISSANDDISKCHSRWNSYMSRIRGEFLNVSSQTWRGGLLLIVCSCCLCSLCVSLHPGLHDRLHRDPTGGQWQPRVHSRGPRATVGCFTGQYAWQLIQYHIRARIFVNTAHRNFVNNS